MVQKLLANTSVFVRGFDFGTTVAQIQAHCAAAGKVTAVEMQGKGGAVVTYSTAGGAQKAIQLLNQSTIHGNSRFIDVKANARSAVPTNGAVARKPLAVAVGGLARKPVAARKPLAVAGPAAARKRPAPAGATGGCRVFIRGFDFGTTDEMFEGHVGQVGTIERVQWCTKGSAIVTYSSPEEAQAAVSQLSGTTIEGNSRYIDCILKEDEDQPRFKAVKTERPGKGGGKGGGKGISDPVGSGRVFVRGFDFGTTDEQLEAHMAQAGEISKVFWASKGSAVVVYKTRQEAEVAAESLNQTVIEGNTRYIDVMARESE